jgi:hypothetical protein
MVSAFVSPEPSCLPLPNLHASCAGRVACCQSNGAAASGSGVLVMAAAHKRAGTKRNPTKARYAPREVLTHLKGLPDKAY